MPAFNVAGWYDVFLGGSLENSAGMRARGATRGRATGSGWSWARGGTRPRRLADPSGDVMFGLRSGGADLIWRAPAAVLRSLAQGHRARPGRRPAGTPVRHGRRSLARRGRVAARPGGADELSPPRGRAARLETPARRRGAGHVHRRPERSRPNARRQPLLLAARPPARRLRPARRSRRATTSSSIRPRRSPRTSKSPARSWPMSSSLDRARLRRHRQARRRRAGRLRPQRRRGHPSSSLPPPRG